MRKVSELFDQFLLLFLRKRLYLLIFKAFVGPFITSFFVLMLIFLVQTLVKYQSEIFGKGLGFFTYIELIFYLAFNVIPKALPFAVMMGGLITYGSLGEHGELNAIKSAGVSLLRLILPSFIFSILAGVGLYYLGDVILPKTNLKFYSLLYDIKTKQPAFNLTPGMFYNGIDGYRIKAGSKDDAGRIKDVMVYDHTHKNGNTEVIVADSGLIYNDKKSGVLIFELYNGERYSENTSREQSKKRSTNSIQTTRTSFDKVMMPFDISSMSMKNTPDERFSRNRWMMNSDTLKIEIDTLGKLVADRRLELKTASTRVLGIDFVYNDLLIVKELEIKKDVILTSVQKKQVAQSVANDATNMMFHLERENDYIEWKSNSYVKFWVEYYHRRTEAVACVLFLLIGASLGAVLKKGGIGMPMLVTVMMFLLHHVMTEFFEKKARAQEIIPLLGGWGSVLVMTVIAIWVAYKTYLDKRIIG